MDVLKEAVAVISSVLNFHVDADPNVALLGAMPEFDSQAVVSIITTLEEHLDIFIEDDEITAEIFETVGTLVDFLETKL